MKKFLGYLHRRMILGIAGAACTGEAWADSIMVTKTSPPAAMPASPPPPAPCSSVWDFVATACPLTWYGITVYGTIDVGGGWLSHWDSIQWDIRCRTRISRPEE